MSYHCNECNKIYTGKELKVTKEIRDVEYKHLIEKQSRNPQEESTFFVHNESKGKEAVEISKLCDACYEVLKDNEPKVSSEKKIVKVIVSQKDARKIRDKKRDDTENRRSRKFNKKDTKSSVSYDKSGSFKSFEDLV